MRGLGGDQLIRGYIEHIPYGKWGVLAIVMTLIFVLGFILDQKGLMYNLSLEGSKISRIER